MSDNRAMNERTLKALAARAEEFTQYIGGGEVFRVKGLGARALRWELVSMSADGTAKVTNSQQGEQEVKLTELVYHPVQSRASAPAPTRESMGSAQRMIEQAGMDLPEDLTKITDAQIDALLN